MKELLYNLSSIYLAIFGILFAIFTLFYSFISSKRNDLGVLAENIKLGVKDPLTLHKSKILTDYIKILEKRNSKCIILFISSFFLFLLSFLGSLFLSTKIFFIIIIVLSIIFCVFFIFFIVKILKEYKNDIKI